MHDHAMIAPAAANADDYAKDPICGMVVKKAGALSPERGGRSGAPA